MLNLLFLSVVAMLDLNEVYEDLVTGVRNSDEHTVRRIIETCRVASIHHLQQLLHLAIEKDDLGVVQSLLRFRIDVMHEDGEGHRTIHVAAQYGNSSIVKAVINAGSPINIVDGRGIGALHMCLENNHDAAAMMLIKEGATVNRPRRYDTGEAPIHIAAKLGLNEVLQFMILKGGDVNLMSGDHSTPLHLAIKEKHPRTVKLLCEAGSNVNTCNAKGMT